MKPVTLECESTYLTDFFCYIQMQQSTKPNICKPYPRLTTQGQNRNAVKSYYNKINEITTYTSKLASECQVYGVCFEFEIWSVCCFHHCVQCMILFWTVKSHITQSILYQLLLYNSSPVGDRYGSLLWIQIWLVLYLSHRHCCAICNINTLRPRQTAAIFQRTFSNTFS